MQVALMVVMVMGLMTGCSLLGQVSEDDLAAGVEKAAKGAARFGVKYACEKEPDKAPEILANAKLASDIIKTTVLPIFEGAATQDVLCSAIETALVALGGKLNPQMVATIQLALDLAASKIDLPDNPAAKLDDRTRKVVAAFFRGTAAGLDAAVGDKAVVARDGKGARLFWPKN